MLKLLRKKKVAKRVFYVLCLLIIPAFVIWGSASVINKNKESQYAGKLFGRTVSHDEFRGAMSAWKTQMRLQYGDEAEKGLGSLFDPVEGAWDRLILLHEVKKRNIRISDKELIETITGLPFLTKNGSFSSQSYDLFLKYSLGINARQFEEQMRQNLAMSKIYQDLTKGVSLSDEEARAEYEKQFVQTKLRYVLFSPQDYKKSVKVSDDDIKKHYLESKEKFKIPPQINVLMASIEYKEGYGPEDEQKAQETMKEVSKKAKAVGLKKAATEAGVNAKETGFFGFDDPIPGLGWMPQFKNLLFDTPKGNMTQVVATDRGVYLFSILEKKEAYIPEFKDAKEKVKDALIEQKASDIALEKAVGFISKVTKTADQGPKEEKTKKARSRGKKSKPEQPLTFEKAAQAEGLAAKETQLFSRTSYIPELGMAEALKEAAFTLKKNEIYPKPVIVSQGFCVIQSTETPTLNEEKFKKEKDEFKKNVLEQKKAEVFNTFFKGLKKEAGLVSFVKPMRQITPPAVES